MWETLHCRSTPAPVSSCLCAQLFHMISSYSPPHHPTNSLSSLLCDYCGSLSVFVCLAEPVFTDRTAPASRTASPLLHFLFLLHLVTAFTMAPTTSPCVRAVTLSAATTFCLSLLIALHLSLCLSHTVSALQPHSHTHTLTITCTCCYDEIKGTQDLKIHSHADAQILSRCISRTVSLPHPMLSRCVSLSVRLSLTVCLSPTVSLYCGSPSVCASLRDSLTYIWVFRNFRSALEKD